MDWRAWVALVLIYLAYFALMLMALRNWGRS